MAQSITSMYRDGQQYMETWPMVSELYGMFPECKVILATRLAIKIMPALAVISASIHLNAFGLEFLPQSLTIAAFFLSLPLQGMLWLGHRSNQVLPPSMAIWYRDIHSKMRVHGCNLQSAKARPRYRELAGLLKTAFKELDKVFTKQLF